MTNAILNQAKRRAKIVATLGPASSSVSMIEKLIQVGVDVARVNMSHGTHETHAQLIANIRKASQNIQREIGILLDLQGPKIRVSKLQSPLQLEAGQEWIIVPESLLENFHGKQEKVIPTTYEGILKDLINGAQILFDDGLLEAEVKKVHEDHVVIKIVVGGILKSNKGINLPNIKVSAPSLTKKMQMTFFLEYKTVLIMWLLVLLEKQKILQMLKRC